MSKVILLLGSNLGNRKYYLNTAKELIGFEVGSIFKESSIYESEPWGFKSDEFFLNQVLIVETLNPPHQLLKNLQKIEKELGRKIKSSVYQNRTIDIDILFYDDLILEDENLIIPHPRLHQRQFTMVPLIEIAADCIHPVFGIRLDMLDTNFLSTKSVKVLDHVKPALTLINK